MKKSNGSKAVATAKKLEKRLKDADEAYFNRSKRVMTDEAYDEMKDRLARVTKALAGKGASLKTPKVKKLVRRLQCYLDSTGREPNGTKVKLPVYMPSLDKLKNDNPDKFWKWVAKQKGTKYFIVSPKLDGSSMLLHYAKGTLVGGFTRGNGHIGRTVDAQVRMLRKFGRIPGSVASFRNKEHAYVRGELMIEEKVFVEHWSSRTGKSHKNLVESRNAVNGFLNSNPESLDKKFASCLDFIAYQVAPQEWGMRKQLKELNRAKFTTYTSCPQFKVLEAGSLPRSLPEVLNKLLQELGSMKYKADGLVVEASARSVRSKSLEKTDKRPEYARAYKVAASDLSGQQVSTTKVLKVEWNPSKTGKLVPLVHYEPVWFGKTVNTKATGIHAKWISTHGVGKGTTIQVVRSGGVIPKIVKVLGGKVTGAAALPSKCACGSKLFMGKNDLYCSNSDCKFMAFHKLKSAVSYLDVPGLAKSRVKQMYDHGVESVMQLLKNDGKGLGKIQGWAALAPKVQERIKEVKARLTPVDKMVLSGVFFDPGFSLAEKWLRKIHAELGEAVMKPLGKKEMGLIHKEFGGRVEECFIEHHLEFLSRWKHD